MWSTLFLLQVPCASHLVNQLSAGHCGVGVIKGLTFIINWCEVNQLSAGHCGVELLRVLLLFLISMQPSYNWVHCLKQVLRGTIFFWLFELSLLGYKPVFSWHWWCNELYRICLVSYWQAYHCSRCILKC